MQAIGHLGKLALLNKISENSSQFLITALACSFQSLRITCVDTDPFEGVYGTKILGVRELQAILVKKS